MNFENWCNGEVSKFEHYFSKKSNLKVGSLSNVNNKKWAPKLIFFNDKKIEKDFDDFIVNKSTLKVKLRHFLTSPYYNNSQNSKISFGYVHFKQNSFQFCTPRVKT